MTYTYTGSSDAFVIAGGGLGNPVRFYVDGTIYSQGFGISLSGGSGFVAISRTGSVFADATAITTVGRVETSGTIRGSMAISTANYLTVTNSGKIICDSTAVKGGIIADIVTNTSAGVITAAIKRSSGNDTVINDGAITGDVTFADLSSELARLTNTGTLTGSVVLGAGGDVLRNTGTITGNITTGSRRDAVINDADVFAFSRLFLSPSATLGWGQDRITDFQDGTDKIDLSRAFGIHAFSDLTISQSGSNAVIAYASDTITLSNFTATNLSAADFVFG